MYLVIWNEYLVFWIWLLVCWFIVGVVVVYVFLVVVDLDVVMVVLGLVVGCLGIVVVWGGYYFIMWGGWWCVDVYIDVDYLCLCGRCQGCGGSECRQGCEKDEGEVSDFGFYVGFL